MGRSVSSLSYAGAVSIAVACLLGMVLLELVGILWLCGGQLFFTLDDPYIHLALAENLARGHYGVNLGEPSSPSSSVLWPFLLAPFAAQLWAPWAVLGLNVALGIGGVLAMAQMLRPRSPSGSDHAALALLLAALVVGVNGVGLIFTGMEHSAQLWCACLIVAGLVREGEEGPPPRWLWPVIVVAPLVRYECLALSGPALAYLFLRGHRGRAVVTGAAAALLLGGFSLFLVGQGLPPLPASVMAKSQVVSSGGGLGKLASNLIDALGSGRGMALVVGMLALGWVALDARRASPLRLLALAQVGAAGLHLLVGRYGWYNRYEIYIYASTLLVLLYAHKDALFRGLQGPERWRGLVWGAAAWGLLSAPYFYSLVTTPLAARNVYQQQHQMHRFAAEVVQGPVAVNDLGWVAWRFEPYVLDLGGLASVEVQRAKVEDNAGEWLGRLVATREVPVVMIYDAWFKKIPASWLKLGELKLGGAAITAAGPVVAFYATDCSTFSRLSPALEGYRSSLPLGAAFVVDPGSAARCEPGAPSP